MIFGPLSNTRWSNNFSEHKFDKIKPGMPKTDMMAILGEPLVVKSFDKDDLAYYVYSWNAEAENLLNYDGTFHRREVKITSQGLVAEVFKTFEVD
jgi:outer membrane protein assembly factor BamE (lipoprotein component of BamABCDE complex)